MTTAKFFEGTGSLSFCISGHSGFAERGKDIVCAGISTMAFTIVDVIDRYPELNAEIFIDSQIDTIAVRVSPKDDSARKTAEVLLDVLQSGLLALANEYPDYIDVILSGEEVFTIGR